MGIRNFLIGDTIKLTWINSGTAAADLHHEVYDGNESLVDSLAMTSSGDGHYYSFFSIPDSDAGAGYYSVKLKGSISGFQYVRGHIFKAVKGEVD